MTYRSDGDAKDEQTRARIVRIRSELHALEAQIGAPSPARRERWAWLGGGVVIGGTLVSLVFGALTFGGQMLGRPALEGAPDSPREQPNRSEIDAELVRLDEEMQGCAPAGFTGIVQADVTFEGARGAIADVDLFNRGDTSLDPGMIPCIEQTFLRVGTPRFRVASYLYRTTLTWVDGRLQSEPR